MHKPNHNLIYSIAKILVLHEQAAETGELGTGFLCSSSTKTWLITCAHLFLDEKGQSTGEFVRVIFPDKPKTHFEYRRHQFNFDNNFHATHNDLALMEWSEAGIPSIPLKC